MRRALLALRAAHRTAPDNSHFATLRACSCCALATGSARIRSASGPYALRATSRSATRNEPLREGTVHAGVHESPPRIASRATYRARSASAAQRESIASRLDPMSSDPSTSSTSSTLREVGGDAPTPRRPRDAKRCETRSVSRRMRHGQRRHTKCGSTNGGVLRGS